MQKLYSEILGMPVFDENSPRPLALIHDVIIDPENGKVLAFLLRHKKVIVPLDVERVTGALYIADRDRILALSEVLRVKMVFEQHIDLIGSKVVSQRGKRVIGNCMDFEIDTTHMMLSKIHVGKSFLFFRFDERIIPTSAIVRIEKEKIIVKDTREKEAEEKVTEQNFAQA